MSTVVLLCPFSRVTCFADTVSTSSDLSYTLIARVITTKQTTIVCNETALKPTTINIQEVPPYVILNAAEIVANCISVRLVERFKTRFYTSSEYVNMTSCVERLIETAQIVEQSLYSSLYECV